MIKRKKIEWPKVQQLQQPYPFAKKPEAKKDELLEAEENEEEGIENKVYDLLCAIIFYAESPIKEVQPLLQLFAKQSADFSITKIEKMFARIKQTKDIDNLENRLLQAKNRILSYRKKHIEKQALREAFSLKNALFPLLSLIIFPIISIPGFIKYIKDKRDDILSEKLDVVELKLTPNEIKDNNLYKRYKVYRQMLEKRNIENKFKAIFHHATPASEYQAYPYTVLPTKLTEIPKRLGVAAKQNPPPKFKINIPILASQSENSKISIFLPKEKQRKFLDNQAGMASDQANFAKFKKKFNL